MCMTSFAWNIFNFFRFLLFFLHKKILRRVILRVILCEKNFKEKKNLCAIFGSHEIYFGWNRIFSPFFFSYHSNLWFCGLLFFFFLLFIFIDLERRFSHAIELHRITYFERLCHWTLNRCWFLKCNFNLIYEMWICIQNWICHCVLNDFKIFKWEQFDLKAIRLQFTKEIVRKIIA